MSYTALARRYRSQSFGQVIGQEPIAQTLRGALAADRLHHAYLFCGTRGVGKTTMARLFARAINAPDTIEDCPKPEGVEFPAEDVQQRMADAIMRGDDMNVIEIDGASNRGVDDARQLIANASLAPTGQARFKVYIIDEVHMLTKDAFNTLLKTMEEPPAHLKFILCTTEPHKVLPTIHSRCQRFDFHNISTEKIVDHLAAVVSAEGVEAETSVLFAVAKQANGSMRDGLSLLDRLMAAGAGKLDNELLGNMLGLPDEQLVADLIGAIGSAQVDQTLKGCDQLLRRGIGQDQLIEAMIERLRTLMVFSACGPETDLVDIDASSRDAAVEQAKQFDTVLLVHAIALLESVQRMSRASAAPRALLDAALVRLAMNDRFADLASLVGTAGDGQKKKVVAVADASAFKATPRLVASTPAAAAPTSRPTPTPQPSPRPATVTKRPVGPTQSVAPDSPISNSERDSLMNSPLVKDVVDLFDATLVDVRPDPTDGVEDKES
jgi:DNA polymerase-3 subunit gamma/tau